MAQPLQHHPGRGWGVVRTMTTLEKTPILTNIKTTSYDSNSITLKALKQWNSKFY